MCCVPYAQLKIIFRMILADVAARSGCAAAAAVGQLLPG
jgi:hypothetical protein